MLLPGVSRGGATPCKPGLADIRFQLRHAGRGCAFVNNPRPFRYHVDQHGALLLVHGGSFEALGLDGLPVLPGAEHQIGQTVTQNGLLPLVLVQGIEQGEAPCRSPARAAARFSRRRV